MHIKMTIPNSLVKNIRFAVLLIASVFIATFQSCKRKTSDMANILYKKTPNKIFKNIDPDELSAVFEQVLHDQRSRVTYPQVLKSY